MKLISWILWLGKATNGSHAKVMSFIQSQESFRASVVRERRRVDRNKHILSLLLFTIDKKSGKGDMTQRLTHVLAERIRSTDEAGWYDNESIGVILPYTCTDGAYKLANEICNAFHPEVLVPKYVVHTYPSKQPLDSGGDSGQFAIVDLPSKQKAKTPRGTSLPALHSQNANFVTSTSSSSPLTSDVIGPCGALSQAIHPFFPQPFPIWKRIIDVLGSLFGLIVLSPILLLVALIIKVGYGGPVIFKQQRVGYSGKIFTMWKFRTMKSGAENSLHQKYMSNLIHDAKEEDSIKAMAKIDRGLPVTGFGRILRAMSLDEIPQLFNVLIGDMALIGPRPPTVYEAKHYLPWYCERFGIVPGMTGLWQVSGKNKLTFLEMIRLDIKYIRRLSLWSDIVILLKTPLVIVSDIVDFINNRKT